MTHYLDAVQDLTRDGTTVVDRLDTPEHSLKVATRIRTHWTASTRTSWSLLMSLAVVGAQWHTPLDAVGSILLSVGMRLGNELVEKQRRSGKHRVDGDTKKCPSDIAEGEGDDQGSAYRRGGEEFGEVDPGSDGRRRAQPRDRGVSNRTVSGRAPRPRPRPRLREGTSSAMTLSLARSTESKLRGPREVVVWSQRGVRNSGAPGDYESNWDTSPMQRIP